jgi:hypothetical protein
MVNERSLASARSLFADPATCRTDAAGRQGVTDDGSKLDSGTVLRHMATHLNQVEAETRPIHVVSDVGRSLSSLSHTDVPYKYRNVICKEKRTVGTEAIEMEGQQHISDEIRKTYKTLHRTGVTSVPEGQLHQCYFIQFYDVCNYCVIVFMLDVTWQKYSYYVLEF